MAERDLVRRAQRGDTQAFTELATPCESMVWSTCYRLLGNREDAEDTAQTALLKAWEKIGSFAGDAAFSTWLYRIAVTTCMDALRRRKIRMAASVEALSENGFDIPDPKSGPEEQVETLDRRARLRNALDQLPDEQRLPLLLFYTEQKPYEEIASLLSLPMGTVKSRISRGRIALKKLMDADECLSSVQPGTNPPPVRQTEQKGGR